MEVRNGHVFSYADNNVWGKHEQRISAKVVIYECYNLLEGDYGEKIPYLVFSNIINSFLKIERSPKKPASTSTCLYFNSAKSDQISDIVRKNRRMRNWTINADKKRKFVRRWSQKIDYWPRAFVKRGLLDRLDEEPELVDTLFAMKPLYFSRCWN